MYIQDRVLEYAEEIFNMIENPKTHIYLCGLKGMEPGIDEAMSTAAAAKGLDWSELRPKLRKAGRWHAETYQINKKVWKAIIFHYFINIFSIFN